MNPQSLPRKLNRYTTLPVLFDLLSRKRLVLLDPEKWEDKNDALIIRAYKKKNGIPSLFAVCFGTEAETLHYWKTYANGISGCCIEFDAAKLLKSFLGEKGYRCGFVDYRKIPPRNKLNPTPFVKRLPYRYEREFRIV